MSNQAVTPIYQNFLDRDGQPLENGYVYIGVAGLDAVANPQTVYWDVAGTIPATQPIRTSGGYLMRSGSPGQIYVGADYSISIKDRNQVVVGSALTFDKDIDATNIDFTAGGTGAVERSLKSVLKDFSVNVRDYGAYGDGKHDDTVAIQAAMDAAASVLTNGVPPSIYMDIYQHPVVFFPPGAYRITDTISVYTGLSVTGLSEPAYTTESTRIIMDTATSASLATGSEVGGAVNLDKHIFKLVKTYGVTTLNSNNNTTISKLGFWVMNPNSTLASRGGSGNATDPVTGLGTTGNACAIYCDEPLVDTRIANCNFYSVPNAAIFVDGSSKSTGSIEVHDCEFDTPIIGIRFSDSSSGLRAFNNVFFSGSFSILLDDCTGVAEIKSNNFQTNARVAIQNSVMSHVHFSGNSFDSCNSSYGLKIEYSESTNVIDNIFGIASGSTIKIIDCTGGAICSNTIYNSGYNAVAANPPADLEGAIVLDTCYGFTVSNNSILTPDAATYNNFGILSYGTPTGKTNIFSSNIISESYTGATYNSRSRRINVADIDVETNNNIVDSSLSESILARNSNSGIFSSKETYVGSTGNSTIEMRYFRFARILVAFRAVSTNDFDFFEVLVGKNTAGTYTIKDVSKNHASGAGAGPHTISAGPNTITFSISSTSLQIAFSIATDPMLFSYIMDGTVSA